MAAKRPVGDTSFEKQDNIIPPPSTGRQRRASASMADDKMRVMPAFVPLDKSGKAIRPKPKKGGRFIATVPR